MIGVHGQDRAKGALSYATQLLSTNQPIPAPRWADQHPWTETVTTMAGPAIYWRGHCLHRQTAIPKSPANHVPSLLQLQQRRLQHLPHAPRWTAPELQQCCGGKGTYPHHLSV